MNDREHLEEHREARAPLPAVVVGLGWVSLLTDAASEMLYPLLPAFLRSLGAGAAALGVLEGVAEATAALVRWISGQASDRMRSRTPIVLLGYALAAIARPLVALSAAPWHVVALRAVDRVGKGLRAAPRDAMIASAVPAARRAEAFGFHRMMDNVGASIGPLIALALARGAGLSTRTIFGLAVVPGAIAVLVLAARVRDPRADGRSTRAPSEANGAPLGAPARRYLAAVTLFTLGASADSFLLLRMLSQGLAEAWLPLVWLSLSAVRAVTNVPGGRFSDRIGHRRALALAWVLYAASYAAMPLAPSWGVTWAIVLVYGAHYGLAEGGARAVVAELVPEGARGRAYGALEAITGMAVLPANAIFGLLMEIDARYAFWTGATCALAGAIVLATATRDAPRA
jgi:MFS family permease